jgi:hypothetical protein
VTCPDNSLNCDIAFCTGGLCSYAVSPCPPVP